MHVVEHFFVDIVTEHLVMCTLDRNHIYWTWGQSKNLMEMNQEVSFLSCPQSLVFMSSQTPSHLSHSSDAATATATEPAQRAGLSELELILVALDGQVMGGHRQPWPLVGYVGLRSVVQARNLVRLTSGPALPLPPPPSPMPNQEILKLGKDRGMVTTERVAN